MGTKSNSPAVIVIIALVFLGIAIIGNANAQVIPTPSVPQFTIQLVDHPYDVPTTTTSTIDQ